jgi:uncharacterized membrane protein YkoI
MKTLILATGISLALCAGLAQAKETSQASLMKQAKVSESTARTTALATVPSGTVASSELEKEHGKLVWSFDISSPGASGATEVQVDAISGKIISTEHESAAKEATEAAEEKMEKH